MTNRQMPKLVVAADWSKNAKKRWMVRAELTDNETYLVSAPEPVGQPETLLNKLKNQSEADASILVGFDFPIGLPADYAQRAGISCFRAALNQFGQGDWKEFYDISDSPNLHRPFSPLPKGKGQKGDYLNRLLVGLGYKSKTEFLRRCDQNSKTRKAAECLFFTCGGKQVGAAAIVGWRDVITPALNQIKIWPFDGQLSSLMSKPGVTIAEIYPGEAYSHLNICMGKNSKRNREHRRAVIRPLLQELQFGPVKLSHAAESWFEWGFLDEDDFDAMIGLLAMLLVVTGKRSDLIPEDENIRQMEGWILGQAG